MLKFDFKNVKLRDIDFSSLNLNGADFSGSNLSYCDFTGSDLHNVNFSGATLRYCDFSGCSIQGLIGIPEIDQKGLLRELLWIVQNPQYDHFHWRDTLLFSGSKLAGLGYDSGLGYLIIRQALPDLEIDHQEAWKLNKSLEAQFAMHDLALPTR